MRKNKVQHKQGFIQGIKSSRALYLLLLPSFIIFLLFTYYPMYGVIIAFKDFSPAQGILGSPWVGFKNFIQYFNSYQFWPTIRNTIVISLYTIVVTFPLPVFLALMCNQIRARRFKKYRNYCKVSRDFWFYTSKPYGFSVGVSKYLCMDGGLAACGVG